MNSFRVLAAIAFPSNSLHMFIPLAQFSSPGGAGFICSATNVAQLDLQARWGSGFGERAITRPVNIMILSHHHRCGSLSVCRGRGWGGGGGGGCATPGGGLPAMRRPHCVTLTLPLWEAVAILYGLHLWLRESGPGDTLSESRALPSGSNLPH